MNDVAARSQYVIPNPTYNYCKEEPAAGDAGGPESPTLSHIRYSLLPTPYSLKRSARGGVR